MVLIGSADDYCNTLEVKPWFFPPVGKMFLKMIQTGDFYYDKKRKEKWKRNDAIGATNITTHGTLNTHQI